MTQVLFPSIDLRATGENIIRLRKANGFTVRELQHYFGFEEPQALSINGSKANACRRSITFSLSAGCSVFQ